MEINIISKEELLSKRLQLLDDILRITLDMINYNKRQNKRLNTIRNKIRAVEKIIE